MRRIISPPIRFAHRGARADAPENTLEAFTLAKAKGATGLESDVWITSDGVAVLDHDGIVKTLARRRPIAEVKRSALPKHIPTLDELYEAVGPELPLSLDMKDPRAYDATVASARNAGAASNLWICDHDYERAASLRATYPDVHLIDTTRLRRLQDGPERHAARLANAGIDGINMHHTDWTGGLTALFHRFGLVTFGWDAQFPRIVGALLEIEIDGLYSDDVSMMMAVGSAAG